MRRITLRWRYILILTLVTVGLLTAIQEPIGWQYLAWLALVPWVIATVAAGGGGRMALINYAAGALYFGANLYWLIPVTPLGYGALVFYLGWYFVICGYILRQIYLHYRWPFTLVLPLLWVGQEYLRALLLTGFPWFFLAHSQYERLWLIQISDVCGVYGVTFLVAMVNGLGSDLLLRPLVGRPSRQAIHMRRSVPTPYHKPGRLGPKLSAGTLIMLTACVLTGAVLYGQWRWRQGEQTQLAGPFLGLIQENIPQFVKEQGESSEEIFERHVELTRQALQSEPRCGLFVWPETMTCIPVNQEFIHLPEDTLTDYGRRQQAQSRVFDLKLRELARRGAALLVGTPAVDLGIDWDGSERIFRYNSAVLYLPQGKRFERRYDKMHLVPFGEVVPFRETWPWLYRLLNGLTPYDYEYSLDAGRTPTVFTCEAPNEKDKPQSWRFAVAICYEDVMPQVPRRLTFRDGQKQIDFLLNISNDGWFVTGGRDRPVRATTELIQHLAICTFRAVENRIGIARAVNTGISAFIQPNGRVQTGKAGGTLADDPRRRQAEAGTLIDRVYLDGRISFYSRYGDLFALLCSGGAGLLLVAAVLAHGKGRRKRSA